MAARPFEPRSPLSKRAAWLGFLAVAVFFLRTEHRAHLLGALPYLVLLLCPLMHFLHGGHGHSSPRVGSAEQATRERNGS